ncbi:uncharacterized protein LOC117660632 [Pantherophis guttatus]|uniref:Uncharacterized protein LOC117660632 n=1 Tax=Pantherophis guttatus TaxID=94885 RepID=A0ABM3YYX7_PANGU|nr:uncharacterized protein LOC117660632 [Pantherophis guttatus]
MVWTWTSITPNPAEPLQRTAKDLGRSFQVFSPEVKMVSVGVGTRSDWVRKSCPGSGQELVTKMDLWSNFPNDWFDAQCIQENICEEVLGEQISGLSSSGHLYPLLQDTLSNMEHIKEDAEDCPFDSWLLFSSYGIPTQSVI